MALFDEKYTNLFWDGEIAGKTPDANGDYYLITDAQADHNYNQEKMADVVSVSSSTPSLDFLIMFGGVVTDSGSGQVDISECVAKGNDSSGNKRIIHIPALTNVSLPVGWNDGRSIWCIARHDFKLSAATRTHKASGVYHYQLEDTYFGDSDGYVSTLATDLFTTTDPVATDVILGKFTMTGTTFADLGVRSPVYKASDSDKLDGKHFQDVVDALYPVGSFYVQYPDAASNDDATAFPTLRRPASMFGGTWVEQFNTDSVFFKTGNVDGQTRVNGLSADQIQNISGTINAYNNPFSSAAGACSVVTSGNGRTTAGALAGYSTINFSASGSTDARTGTKTEPRNRLMKVWKRTVL